MKSFPSLGRAFDAPEEATETGPSGCCVVSAHECSREGDDLGPTIEEFASAHQLPPRWVELRNACRQLAGRADFWYRADLRDAARPPAVEASEILHSSVGRIGRCTKEGMLQASSQNVHEASGGGYQPANLPQASPGRAKQSSLTRTHEAYMRRAIALARIAFPNGDTPVGSLVIHKGKVIAEGFEAVKMQVDVSGHAELIAIRNACSALQTFDLTGCTLCTTAEPCFMCSYAVRQTRISNVIIGRPTPRVGGISSLHPILTDTQIPGWGQPPDIVSGVLEAECCALESSANAGLPLEPHGENDVRWRPGSSCAGPRAEGGGSLKPEDIRMYTRVGCEDSNAARDFLEKQGVRFEEVDIDTNPVALEFVMSVNEGKQRTPTFEADGHTFHCSPFDRQKLVREFGLQRTVAARKRRGGRVRD